MHALGWLLGTGGATTALVQLRLHLRDQADRQFARYVFDQTRSTRALHGYARLLHERRFIPDRSASPASDKQDGPPG